MRLMHFRLLVLGLLLSSITNLSKPSVAAEVSPTERQTQMGLEAFQRGDFEQAILNWTEASRLYERSGDIPQQCQALVNLSQADQALGRYKEAGKNLESALALAERAGDRTQLASVLGALGNLYVATGPPDTAQKYLSEGLRVARELDNPALSAVILNNLGNALTVQKKYSEAVATYRQAVTLADSTNNPSLAARALTNATAASMHNRQYKEARVLLDKARDQVRALETSHDKAAGLINLGLAYSDLRTNLTDVKDSLSLAAFQSFTEAARVAENIGDRRGSSYAWGYLGKLYDEEHRHQEALQVTRRATFAAQQINAPESLYRWEWQTGRLLRKTGMTDDAIGSYRRAVRTLQSIRPELSVSYGAPQDSFRETMGPLYFELVDLLLQRAASLQERDQVGPYLIEAREAVELFKAAELRDYFRDDCVDTALAKVTKLDVVSQTAVVIYPILLRDRIELLISLPTGLKSVVVPVRLETVTREVREFRRKLEKR